MPIIKSAIKRVRVAKRKTQKNRIVKTNTKETMKTFMEFITTGKIAEAKELFSQVQKVCDTMVKKNLWHKNKVARKISRLAKMLKNAKPVEAAAPKKKASTKKTAAKPKTAKKETKK